MLTSLTFDSFGVELSFDAFSSDTSSADENSDERLSDTETCPEDTLLSVTELLFVPSSKLHPLIGKTQIKPVSSKQTVRLEYFIAPILSVF